MAIVAVYEFENGVKCAINDACYAGKTEEELEAARERTRIIARRILNRKIRRELGWNEKNDEPEW